MNLFSKDTTCPAMAGLRKTDMLRLFLKKYCEMIL
jgi:hypothetical protein